ncbi:trypsin-like peptidase domain-containing protein [Luteolibacter ambystomatis]|uniref:Trypsin-like peptidase domain-containing protein n=1 Tax=Luteolibacter ambystomatis TaxID=2824561 RepID=A0A975G5A5_9BACT|nr:trypsin-like peptidase domain-containing protein [Luteolibacter ambystomatis]QUE49359.1 trypsin-like peptidase domain-containing protein [Luteolibacter ambystomatis]
MLLRSPTGLWISGALVFSLLAGCTKKADRASSSEIRELREEMAAMKAEKPKTDENAALKAEIQALKAGTLQIEPLRLKLDASEREVEELRQKLNDLKKENAELRAKTVSRARLKGVGESFPELACPGGRTYQNAVIRSIGDRAVTIHHDGGVANLGPDTVPREWVKRFYLDDGSNPVTIAASLPVSPSPVAALSSSAVPPAASAAAPEAVDASKADEISNRLTRAAVIIKGDKGVGTGFFASDGETVWLYTAAHVLSGNTTFEATGVDGRVYKRFGMFQVAENADLARFAMLESVPVAAELFGARPCVAGSEVVAIGNSGGAGVFTVLRGKVKAVGPGEVETDASIIQGNSGGLLASAADGRVIGVVTRMVAARQDVWSENTPFSEVRRFAARLDDNVRWRQMTPATFMAEPRTIAEFNRVTRLLWALAELVPTKSGLRLTSQIRGSNFTALAIFNENRDSAAVVNLLKMNTSLMENNLKVSDADLVRRYFSFYNSISAAAQSQTSNFDPERISSYNRDAAKLALKWRKEAQAALAQNMASLR